MNVYWAVLLAHSRLRWAVLVVCVVLLAETFIGWLRARPWTHFDAGLQGAFTVLVDVQVLLGLWLYFFLSPLSRGFLAGAGVGMKDPTLRFFGLEHAVATLLAAAVVHVGRVATRRALTPTRSHGVACVTAALVLLVLVAAIPWPYTRYGRPLFRTAVTEPSRSMLV